MIPMVVPRNTVTAVALVEMISEIRRPYRSWAKMSRPVPHSTPSGCAAVMPPQSAMGLPPVSLIDEGSNLYGSMPTMPAMIGPMIAVP